MKKAVSVLHAPPLQQSLYPPFAESQRNAMRLCVLHNLYFYNTMMEEIRNALDEGCYEEYKQKIKESMAAGPK